MSRRAAWVKLLLRSHQCMWGGLEDAIVLLKRIERHWGVLFASSGIVIVFFFCSTATEMRIKVSLTVHLSYWTPECARFYVVVITMSA